MKKFFIIFLLIFSNIHLFSQEALKSFEENYFDFLSLSGLIERPTLGYRTLSDSFWNLSPVTNHIWQNNNLGTTNILYESENQGNNWFSKGFYHGFKYKIYGPEWFNSYNTAAPYGQNDGALWQGKGYNTSLTGGIRFEGYGFEATFKPMLCWMENKEFDKNNEIYKKPYLYSFYCKYFTHLIDFVQQYGDDSFFNFSFGDSELRWNCYTFTIGFGTQSPWLGPAQLNPMLGSNNAEPYPKLDIGFRKTKVILPKLNWYIGDIEGRIWSGMLFESDYFDNNPENNKRMLNCLSASYSPSFIPGLTVGLNRIYMTYWKAENFFYLLRLLTKNDFNGTNNGNDEDQKISAFIDWKFDKVGFEVYGEFGRDDFSSNEISNPFHTAIYTVGAKQIIPLPWGLSSQLFFEWNDFEMSQDFQIQWTYLGFYGHGFVRQGYTNNGQIIGAGSGAFGNSQYIKYKVYFNKGDFSLFFHRYCPNNNSVYSMGVNTIGGRDTEVYEKWYAVFETYRNYGIEIEYFLRKDFILNASYVISQIQCRNYEDITMYNNYFKLNFKYIF